MFRRTYQTTPQPYNRPPDRFRHYETDEYSYDEYTYVEVTPKPRPANPIPVFLLFLILLLLLALAIGSDENSDFQRAQAPELSPYSDTWSVDESEWCDLTAGERLDRYGKIFLDADKRPLTEEDLRFLQNDPVYSYKELLGYAINSFYAAHGFDYRNNAKYQEKFGRQPWYHPKTTDEEWVVSKMNGYENQNRVFLANKREDISK